jgi:hypothetical protein
METKISETLSFSSILTWLIVRQDFHTIMSRCFTKETATSSQIQTEREVVRRIGSPCMGLQQQKVADVAIILATDFWTRNCAVLRIHCASTARFVSFPDLARIHMFHHLSVLSSSRTLMLRFSINKALTLL